LGLGAEEGVDTDDEGRGRAEHLQQFAREDGDIGEAVRRERERDTHTHRHRHAHTHTHTRTYVKDKPRHRQEVSITRLSKLHLKR